MKKSRSTTGGKNGENMHIVNLCLIFLADRKLIKSGRQ